MSQKDQIYQTNASAIPVKPGSFVFDARVASVFEDMISRSVPGYQQILEMLPTLVRQCQKKQQQNSISNYYDLGCSLGAGMLAMAQGIEAKTANTKLIGIDNSEAMISQANDNLSTLTSQKLDYQLCKQDLLSTELQSGIMVLMNFTLQFIALEHRDKLVKSIHQGMLSGGYFILSEKIKFDSKATNQALIDIHHQFKADQGYSELEISQKRDAIENVLIPETLDSHISRLQRAGFRVVTPWVQNLQFISILAIK